MRSRRASSRVDVWSSHLSYADCWVAVLRTYRLQRAKQLHAPLVDRVSLGTGAHPIPLAVGDRPPVADELPGEHAAGRGWKELGVLDLLDEDQRLLLGAASRLVVALEGEKDDEPEQHREPGRQHSENPGRAIPIREEAVLGRASAHE